MSEFDLYALHGFLGTTSDWHFLDKAIPGAKIHAVDLFSKEYAKPPAGLKAWAKSFIPFISEERKNVLMGYSLGGRLALHAIQQNPALWSAAIIVSTHPGLNSQKDKMERLKEDQKSAKKFLNDPWEPLIKEWNQQAVFKGDTSPIHRYEKNYSRQHLAEVITGWSPGLQDNLCSEISAISFPILWIAGEHDIKYAAIAKNMVLKNPKSQIWIAPDASHRLVWQQPKQFIDRINKFLKGVL